MRWRQFSLAVFAWVMVAAGAPVAAAESECAKVGAWLDPKSGKALALEPLMEALARRPVVLLGEHHDNAEHHRWQLQVLAALHAYRSDMVVGFEMFPRRVQPALDKWAAGTLDAQSFLKETDWRKVWGFDPNLYLPLFHFVRQNRLGMRALNVDRAFVSRVGREGWNAIPSNQRHGLSDPAPASDAYLEYLAGVFVESHPRERAKRPANGSADKESAEPASVMEDEDFKRFVAAQLTWDRAMAESLVTARRDRPTALVVGVMGEGHAKFRYGVPRQLVDLGIPNTAILLPVSPADACKGLPATIADAVFVVAPPRVINKPPPKVRLGVMIEKTGDDVRILRVIKGSIAEASNLAGGDIVVSAAGQPIEKVSQFIAIIQRQAPGTWLPLTIRRDGKNRDLVARFPAQFPSETERLK